MSDNISSALQKMGVTSFDSQMNNMYTSIPCIIVNVRDNLEGMMVDIQPTVSQKLKDGTIKERTVILGVPVQFPVSGSAGLTFPINKGDTGLAVFSMRSLEAWKSGAGYPAAPNNAAKFDASDAIFIPGIQPPSVSVNNPNKRVWSHNTSDVVLVNNIGKAEEVELRLKPDGTVQINTVATVEVNCQNASVNAQQSITLSAANITVDAATTDWFGNINLYGNFLQQGNYDSTGAISFNGIVFNTHVHGSSPGPSNP